MSATPILITVPKYVAISPSPMPRLAESPGPMDTSDCGRGKKRRLDHLTWEEKVQRKKLKNRVAAQTSRDRKKARMDEMEITIEVLKEQTEMLQNKCDTLHSINESLMEKNRKLDQQVEILQQQLEQIQKQRKEDEVVLKSSCVGSKSNENRSAEGIGVGVDTARFERQHSLSLEDNSPLPALQDLLEDFDATKLEELAESLLSDITSNLEDSPTTSCLDATESTSKPEQLPGSVVGPPAELMEPCQNTSDSVVKTESQTSISKDTISDPDTLYGTYNERTNSITIVLPNGDIAVEEAVEEIVSEEEQPLLSDSDSCEDDFDPIKEFLCPKQPVSGIKSPLSEQATSDYGYESIGSPQSDPGGLQFDEFMNETFTELFPSFV